ncbi:MAG: STAS domain-containing protein [Solirubrobacteraceae bacterium]
MAAGFRSNGDGADGVSRVPSRARSRVLEVQVVADRGGSWVSVRGDLDIATADRLRHALREAASGARQGRLTLDLSGVAFIDARGVHELLDAAAHCAEADIALRILAPPAVRRVCRWREWPSGCRSSDATPPPSPVTPRSGPGR